MLQKTVDMLLLTTRLISYQVRSVFSAGKIHRTKDNVKIDSVEQVCTCRPAQLNQASNRRLPE